MDDGERVEQSHGFGRCVGSVGVRRGAYEAWRFEIFHRLSTSAKTDRRTRRAQANDYATMSSGRLVNDCANGKNVDGLACVDVCAEFGEDSQFCRTKCAPRGDADKKYACRAACQDAIAGACDRAFPPTSEDNRKRFEGCLEHTAEECASACDRWR